jgi:ankyrin repeat protein
MLYTLQDERTPLHEAAYEDSVTAAHLLLEHGASIDARDEVMYGSMLVDRNIPNLLILLPFLQNQ